jgi:hypothetical protein
LAVTGEKTPQIPLAPVVAALAVFFFLVPVFSQLIGELYNGNPDEAYSPHTDHNYHIDIAFNLAHKHIVPPRPFFHVAVVALSAGGKAILMPGTTVLVLALAGGARGYLVGLLLARRSRVSVFLTVLFALALVIVMPLPAWWNYVRDLYPKEFGHFHDHMPDWLWNLPSVYPGQVTPNLWHSPTALFAMPFALLVFLAGLAVLERPGYKTVALLSVAMALSVLAKPNFVLAFAPCFGPVLLALMVREVRAGRLESGNAALLVAGAFVPVVLLFLQQFAAITNEMGAPSKVLFDPLTIWKKQSSNIPASVVLGIVFPLVATVLYWREVFRDPAVPLAWAMLVVTTIEYALIREDSPVAGREWHGVFGFGMFPADQILFVVTCAFLLRQPASWRRGASFVAFGMHVLCGVLCLVRGLYVPQLAGLF